MLAGRQIVIIPVTCSHSREYTGAIKWEIFNKSAESYTVTCRSWHDSGRGQFLSPLKSDMMLSKCEGTPPHEKFGLRVTLALEEARLTEGCWDACFQWRPQGHPHLPSGFDRAMILRLWEEWVGFGCIYFSQECLKVFWTSYDPKSWKENSGFFCSH